MMLAKSQKFGNCWIIAVVHPKVLISQRLCDEIFFVRSGVCAVATSELFGLHFFQ